jgi:hypothetical protein
MSVRAIGVVSLALAAVLLGPGYSPVLGGMAANPSGLAYRHADPSALVPRYSGKGWLGIIQAAAASTGSDVDSDPSTVNSSTATLTIPPGSLVQWAGLHWAGDQATRADGSPPRCAAAPDGAPPATPPGAPDQTADVRMSINDSPYATVTATDLSQVSSPGGAPGFQAYADLTAAIRPYGGRATASPLQLTVANVQVASGPGCAGGWDLMVVYAYPNGPDPTYAPVYQSVAVYDPALTQSGNAVLGGLVTPGAAPVTAGVTAALLTAGAPVSATLNGRPVATTNGGTAGYQVSSTPLPDGVLALNASTAGYVLSGGGDSFAAAVLAVGVGLPIAVSLKVTAAFSPTTVAVGTAAQLTLTVRNDADVSDTGVAVTADLPPDVTLTTDNPAYSAASGTWSVGTIAAHATATLTMIVRVNAAGSFSTSAQVTASAVSLSTSPPPTPATATIMAENVAVAPSGNVNGVNEPATLGRPGASSFQLAPGVLIGIGLFGLGLVLLLAIVVRRRSAG